MISLQQLQKLKDLPPIQIKKLMIKRRESVIPAGDSDYQQFVAQQVCFLRNKNFLRQFRKIGQLNDFRYVAESTSSRELYKFEDQMFICSRQDDCFSQYSLEYFNEKLQQTFGFRNISKFIGPDYVFYGVTAVYYLINQDNMAHSLLQYLQQQTEQMKKNAVNHVICCLFQLTSILSVLHQVGLTLNGNFRDFVICKDLVKLNLITLQIRVPETLNQGIAKDLQSFKQLTFNCQDLFVKQNDEQLIRQLNAVYLTLNDAMFNFFNDQTTGKLPGIPISATLKFARQLPFFTAVPHFLSRDITAKLLYATVVRPAVLPIIKSMEIAVIDEEAAAEPRAQSAKRFEFPEKLKYTTYAAENQRRNVLKLQQVFENYNSKISLKLYELNRSASAPGSRFSLSVQRNRSGLSKVGSKMEQRRTYEVKTQDMGEKDAEKPLSRRNSRPSSALSLQNIALHEKEKELKNSNLKLHPMTNLQSFTNTAKSVSRRPQHRVFVQVETKQVQLQLDRAKYQRGFSVDRGRQYRVLHECQKLHVDSPDVDLETIRKSQIKNELLQSIRVKDLSIKPEEPQ